MMMPAPRRAGLKNAWVRKCRMRHRTLDADAHDHVTDLRHRRIGENPFYVPLRATRIAPVSAVSAPIDPTSTRASLDAFTTRAARDQVDAAVTIVAAWIKATRASASIASGNQVCSGTWPI